jgi:hypothetical protein
MPRSNDTAVTFKVEIMPRSIDVLLFVLYTVDFLSQS